MRLEKHNLICLLEVRLICWVLSIKNHFLNEFLNPWKKERHDFPMRLKVYKQGQKSNKSKTSLDGY